MVTYNKKYYLHNYVYTLYIIHVCIECIHYICTKTLIGELMWYSRQYLIVHKESNLPKHFTFYKIRWRNDRMQMTVSTNVFFSISYCLISRKYISIGRFTCHVLLIRTMLRYFTQMNLNWSCESTSFPVRSTCTFAGDRPYAERTRFTGLQVYRVQVKVHRINAKWGQASRSSSCPLSSSLSSCQVKWSLWKMQQDFFFSSYLIKYEYL